MYYCYCYKNPQNIFFKSNVQYILSWNISSQDSLVFLEKESLHDEEDEDDKEKNNNGCQAHQPRL